MLRIFCKSKITGLKVTQAELYYEGSITIDEDILKAADIAVGEKVEVLNLNNGSRIETYALAGKKGSGVVCLNGPAARSGCVGDPLMVLCYCFVDDQEVKSLKTKVIRTNAKNQITK